MPLILAIEPDRRQAALLSGLVRRHTGADLVLADTTERAIGAIGQRVPDLVLVPALLSPQDDAALAAALRVIAAAAHVQTLTIPVLGLPQPKTSSHGVLSILRRGRPPASSPDGCHPTVFAGQIVSYLERLAEERAAATTIDATPFPIADEHETSVEECVGESDAPKELHSAEAAAEAMPGGTLDEEMTGIEEALLSRVGKPGESGSETTIAATSEPDPAIELDELRLAIERREIEWIEELNHVELSGLDAVPRDSATRESPEPAAVVADPIETGSAEAPAPVREPTCVTPRPPSPTRKSGAEWGTLIESLRHDLDRLDAERQHRSGTSAASDLDESRIPSVPRPTGTADPGVRNKQRRPTRPTPAIQDEWGFFDPEQCGFAALLAKLDEITEEREELRRRRA